MVWTPGSLDNRDLRIRWLMILNAQFVQNSNPATTYLPIMDCEEALARIIDRLYAVRQGGAVYDMRKAESEEETWRWRCWSAPTRAWPMYRWTD